MSLCCLLSHPLNPGLQDRVYVTDEYKRVVLEHMSIEQLIDTLMINPTVHLSPSYRDTGLSASYTFQPLSNLVYTRDQQITGCKGIVMGRLRSPQRQLECDLMRFCFKKLGARLFLTTVGMRMPVSSCGKRRQGRYSLHRWTHVSRIP